MPRTGLKVSVGGGCKVIIVSNLETGEKISDLPKLAIRKFFGLNEISFDHEWPNCIVYLILLVILTDFSGLGG